MPDRDETRREWAEMGQGAAERKGKKKGGWRQAGRQIDILDKKGSG